MGEFLSIFAESPLKFKILKPEERHYLNIQIIGWPLPLTLQWIRQGLVKGAKLCFRYPYFYFRHGESTSTASQLTSPASKKSKDFNKVPLLLQDLGQPSAIVIFRWCQSDQVNRSSNVKTFPFLKIMSPTLQRFPCQWIIESACLPSYQGPWWYRIELLIGCNNQWILMS